MAEALNLMGYLMNENEEYDEPTRINTQEEMSAFLINNVEKHYELRVIDSEDLCVFQVIEQTLVFPIPQHGSQNNKWDSEKKKFVNQ